jgi:CheY-like chemotaxis protein
MSSPFSSEHLAHVRDDARRMLEQTRAHEGDLTQLVETAEGVARQAAGLCVALAGADTAGEISRLCSAQVRRSADNAEATRRACRSARRQHVTAHRLCSTIDDPSVDAATGAPRAPVVLVVDDTQDLRDLLAFILQDAGFVVRTAANGLEALLTAYEMRPDVIVMDLTMPVLGGIEATRLIKATAVTRESKVIAHTGNGSIAPSVERWFVAIVSKPSPPEVVLAAVQNAVSL